MNAPDGPATSRQRAQIGALGEHDAANDPDLTFSRASTLIDRLKGNGGHPAPSPPRPTPTERHTTTVAPAPPPREEEKRNEVWVQVAAWIPASRAQALVEAIEAARVGA